VSQCFRSFLVLKLPWRRLLLLRLWLQLRLRLLRLWLQLRLLRLRLRLLRLRLLRLLRLWLRLGSFECPNAHSRLPRRSSSC